MRTYLDCFACFFRQALETSRIAGMDVKKQKQILDEVAKLIPTFSLEVVPPYISRIIYNLIKEQTKDKDPYKKIKEKSNKLILDIYDNLKNKIKKAKDPLLMAVELSIIGNIIDYGAKNHLNVKEEINSIVKGEYKFIKNKNSKFFNYKKFKDILEKAKTVIYLADNTGEIVFDKLLIEQIKSQYKNKEIIYVVREKAIINDVLFEDAIMCGIDKIVKVMKSGCDAPGTLLSLCSKEFLDIYNKADMVISKGQGNFEALSNENKMIFFLFIAKCNVVAQHVGCNIRDIILKSSI